MRLDAALVAGASFRIYGSIKLNGGFLVFKQMDPEPLVNKEHINRAPFISLSFIDFDLKAALGKLGSLFD